MISASELPTIPHGRCQWRSLNDRCGSGSVENRIVEGLAMRDSREQFYGLLRRRTLVQHHADDQDADQPWPHRPVIDEVQADAKAVLVHSIDATGKSVGECEA